MINLTVLKSTAFGLWFLFCWNDNGFHEISCWPSTLSVNIRAEFRILAESTRALFTLKAEITVTNETQRHVDKCVFTELVRKLYVFVQFWAQQCWLREDKEGGSRRCVQASVSVKHSVLKTSAWSFTRDDVNAWVSAHTACLHCCSYSSLVFGIGLLYLCQCQRTSLLANVCRQPAETVGQAVNQHYWLGIGLVVHRSWVRVLARHYHLVALCKPLTPVCLCHQAV